MRRPGAQEPTALRAQGRYVHRRACRTATESQAKTCRKTRSRTASFSLHRLRCLGRRNHLRWLRRAPGKIIVRYVAAPESVVQVDALRNLLRFLGTFIGHATVPR